MIAGIMQPYFFPYFGYFDHIFRCDTWVVFDITQYTPKSWMTRNRILKQNSGWTYINCDVHGTQSMLTHEVKLINIEKTKDQLLGKIAHYKKKAPFYNKVYSIINETFSMCQTNSLTDISVCGLTTVCQYLSIPFNPIIASHEKFTLPPITYSGQWALEICTVLGASEYLNTPGGREIFRPEEFKKRNIRLGFTRVPEFSYDCTPYQFESNLSILDVLMWNSPKTIHSRMGKDPIDYV